jgi:hypothetical protein
MWLGSCMTIWASNHLQTLKKIVRSAAALIRAGPTMSRKTHRKKLTLSGKSVPAACAQVKGFATHLRDLYAKSYANAW